MHIVAELLGLIHAVPDVYWVGKEKLTLGYYLSFEFLS